MNYALAKELKDAGFPNQFCGNLDNEHCDGSCFPTLSELIAECELIGFCLYLEKGKWTAGESDDMGQFNGHTGEGSTPEQAVAMLYLALHGRNKGDTPRLALNK